MQVSHYTSSESSASWARERMLEESYRCPVPDPFIEHSARVVRQVPDRESLLQHSPLTAEKVYDMATAPAGGFPTAMTAADVGKVLGMELIIGMMDPRNRK